MKVFYWTAPQADYPQRFHIANSLDNIIDEVPSHNVGPTYLTELLNSGYTEISSDTAYKLGLPS